MRRLSGIPGGFGSMILAAWLCLCPAGNADAVVVGNFDEFWIALTNANNGKGDKTIEMKDGVYLLEYYSLLPVLADGITIRGLSGDRGAVIFDGSKGEYVSHIFHVQGSDFTLQDMTVRGAIDHVIQILGELDADRPVISNVHIADAGQQLIKVSYDERTGVGSDGGIVEHCLLEYSKGYGPTYYIGGIDAHNAKNWIVRDNTFRGVQSPAESVAEHAIHFWSNSENTIVERNTIINCDRGIGFGLGDKGHRGGIIRNNMIYHGRTGLFADVGIGLESSPGTLVYNNTILQEHDYPNAIEYRFRGTSDVLIANNLTNRRIKRRNGGEATLENNVVAAQGEWFAAPASGDLHLKKKYSLVVDRGVEVAGLRFDFDREKRPHGGGVDVGADEYTGGGDPVEAETPVGAGRRVLDLLFGRD